MAKEKQMTTDEMREQFKSMGMDDAQIEELLRLSGQGNISNFTKVPTLKINTETDADVNGKEVKFGNFVLGQSKDGDTITDIGIDLGDSVEFVIYAAPQQYTRYTKSKEGRCNSGLLFTPQDQAVGSNFGFNCRKKGECPHRDCKDDKCTMQFVCYANVKTPDGWQPCMTYLFKKSNFMPFADYIKSLSGMPLFSVRTNLTKEKRKNGSVTYYEITPAKVGTVTAIEFKENVETAMAVTRGIQDYEKQRTQKQLQNKPSVGNSDGIWNEPSNEAEIVFE